MFKKGNQVKSEPIKIKYNIPEYAKNFQKEWQYIIGINEKCGKFINILFIGMGKSDIFNSLTANSIKFHIKKFLACQECCIFKDISDFYFEYFDVNNIEDLYGRLSDYIDLYFDFNNIEDLLEQLGEYPDLYLDPENNKFNSKIYDFLIDKKIPGYKEFEELIRLFYKKIKRKEPNDSD